MLIQNSFTFEKLCFSFDLHICWIYALKASTRKHFGTNSDFKCTTSMKVI